MDEPTAALGPHETQMVAELIQELKRQGLGIFLIEHDIHAVMDLCDRAVVMKNGQRVGCVNVGEVTDDDILGMIILGKKPPQPIDVHRVGPWHFRAEGRSDRRGPAGAGRSHRPR
jgi:D-xylose transport system ATP-binding protein